VPSRLAVERSVGFGGLLVGGFEDRN